jgi:hypothetical protein
MTRLVATVVPERRPKLRRTGRDTSERDAVPSLPSRDRRTTSPARFGSSRGSMHPIHGKERGAASAGGRLVGSVRARDAVPDGDWAMNERAAIKVMV